MGNYQNTAGTEYLHKSLKLLFYAVKNWEMELKFGSSGYSLTWVPIEQSLTAKTDQDLFYAETLNNAMGTYNIYSFRMVAEV